MNDEIRRWYHPDHEKCDGSIEMNWNEINRNEIRRWYRPDHEKCDAEEW